MSAKTKQGKPCKRCGQTKRYTINNRCVVCSKASSIKSTKKARKTVDRNWGNQSYGGMPLPEKPNRRGWPGRRNIDGQKVYDDPIVHLGLGDVGSFT